MRISICTRELDVVEMKSMNKIIREHLCTTYKKKYQPFRSILELYKILLTMSHICKIVLNRVKRSSHPEIII